MLKKDGIDPSTLDKKDRFNFHVAATVEINGKDYVVDPYYHKSYLSISEVSDWINAQYPKGQKTEPLFDNKGNFQGPWALNQKKNIYNKNSSLSIVEYAKGWLKNFAQGKGKNYDGK